MPKPPAPLTDAQLRAEIAKCEYCAEKPCREACPADCSPADFIMAAAVGGAADFCRAAALILGNNPLGGVCGAVCPERHCMQACVHATFDRAVAIPAVQAAIIQRAKSLGVLPRFGSAAPQGRTVAVVGAGPAGLAAAALLVQQGVAVDLFDREHRAGGMANLIPAWRLDARILRSDIRFLQGLGPLRLRLGREIGDAAALLDRGDYDAAIVAVGLNRPLALGVRGEKSARRWDDFLININDINLRRRNVAVIGGGAVAADCALAAAGRGAAVEMICLERPSEMPLESGEREALAAAGVLISGRLAVSAISARGGRLGLRLQPMRLPTGKEFAPRAMVADAEQAVCQRTVDQVVVAIGSRCDFPRPERRGLFYAGDMINGPTTVVEAVASGKNAAQRALDLLAQRRRKSRGRDTKSRLILAGRNLRPVPLDCDFFGRRLISPFILSASPASDGYEQMKKAYEAGWAGGVLKTAFAGVPIHIPADYMFVLEASTYGNCDNVSGHDLERVCREIARLAAEYPDRLTVGSTGGPVSGRDDEDRLVWQANTRRLEEAGAMAIEYSLSCPQGGDGTRGDIVSQDAELTAKIIGWVLEGSRRPKVPKLFKLTGAVTAVQPIVSAIGRVIARFPECRAGVTLANSFPGLGWRKDDGQSWPEGVVIGLSGEGILPISRLTLAKAAPLGVAISGNGGPMNYRQAVDLLALGAGTVQFCTMVLKFGLGIIDDLHSGLSHLLAARGLTSVGRLVGCALPEPIRAFGELPAKKRISALQRDLCRRCGNCGRCPYLAIGLDRGRRPLVDPARCIGCSLCAQSCFAGALYMRERTAAELALLREE